MTGRVTDVKMVRSGLGEPLRIGIAGSLPITTLGSIRTKSWKLLFQRLLPE